MKKIKRIILALGENAFLCILILILIDILIGEFLFYKYALSVDTKEPEVISTFDKFQEKTYQSIIKEWQNREAILKNLSLPSENYTDPFKSNQDKIE
ncbi:MAG: hypothetical protein HYT35_01740 [Candidatus Staskawiczbacteria bacterium]|nr:hypothetical protein [Candidatus Staskawiczbacteria bacterium]